TTSPVVDFMTANLSQTLTFAPGETDKTIAITIIDDTLYELDESVPLSLSNPSNATLGGASSATFTIRKNDLPTVSFSQASYSVGEGVGTVAVTVSLSAPALEPISVHY